MNEAKTQLAKLLAQEDITVRHSNQAKTASFDIKERVLTLPAWSVKNKDILDLMTGHEVAHALWTLIEDWEKSIFEHNLHKGILNVVEDARIEKKLKRKYPGIVKPMVTGYKILEQKGFFYKDSEQLSEFHFVDKMNLHFKLGALRGISFDSDIENSLIEKVSDCETWGDVETVVLEIMEYMKSELEADEQKQDGFGKGAPKEGDDDTGGDFEELQNDDGDSDDFGGMTPKELLDDMVVESQENFDSACEERLINQKEKYQNIRYFTLPEANLGNILVTYKQVLTELGRKAQELDKSYLDAPRVRITAYEQYGRTQPAADDCVGDYSKFRRESVKIVGYMAKEFERKKSAHEYRKETIAKTGVLDMSKIHQYKYNEDIFLRKTLRPDGKNHGIMILVDWSASMAGHIFDTIKQVMNLVWWSQKVNIPYEIYAFTTAYHRPWEGDMNKWEDMEAHTQKHGRHHWKQNYGDAMLGCTEGTDNFNLLQLFSNRMTAKETTQMMRLIFRFGWSHFFRYESWGAYSMGSTPTLPALVTLDKIIPAFQNHYKLDITNLIVMTDGDGNNSFSMIKKPVGTTERADTFSRSTDMRLEDPMNHKSYKLRDFDIKQSRYWQDTQLQERAVMAYLKDRYNINIIGLFLDGDSRGNSVKKRVLEKFLGYEYFQRPLFKDVRANLRKDGVATISQPAHDEFYIVPVGKLADTSGELEVDGSMTAGKIKNAFKKNQSAKFGNKILVNKMMEIIA